MTSQRTDYIITLFTDYSLVLRYRCISEEYNIITVLDVVDKEIYSIPIKHKFDYETLNLINLQVRMLNEDHNTYMDNLYYYLIEA